MQFSREKSKRQLSQESQERACCRDSINPNGGERYRTPAEGKAAPGTGNGSSARGAFRRESARTCEVPLAIEFRHTGWYNDATVSHKLYGLLEKHVITNVLVDTAGRRDLMHMRLTTPTAFIRWIGANEPTSDRARLDEWILRIAKWKKAGLKRLFFFVHRNDEQESPALAAHFIERLNKKIRTALPIPKTLEHKALSRRRR